MSRTFPHRPALDGLRGAAVAMVLVYHLRPGALPGGFIGVDIFFVLSGYLIASLLLVEVDRSGAIDLRHFFVRRVRRLAPAMLLVIVAMALYALVWATPFELQRLRLHGIATLLSVANWKFIAEGITYTDVVAGASPLRHVWSLSIEEQFYLFLPLAIWLVRRLGVRHVRTVVRTGALVLAAVSAVWSAWLSVHGATLSRTYFGTDTRAQALLLGVALGAVQLARPAPISRRMLVGVGASLGAAVLVVFACVGDEQASFMPRFGFALVAVGAALLIAGVDHVGPLRRALSTRPMVGLGVISYGVYLWHWPVIVLLDSRRTGLRAGSIVLLSMQLSLTVSLAVLSYVLVERPIRAGALARRLGGAVAAWTWPVAMAASIALLVVATRPPESYAGTPSADAAVTVPSSPAPVDRSIRVMMLGDSVAHSLAGGAILDFPHVAPWHPDQATVPGLWSLARPGCSFLRGQVKAGGAPLELVALCGNWLHDLDLGLTQHHSTHLVLLLVNDMYDRTVHGRSVPFGSAEYLTMLDALLDQIAHVAASHHVQLVLLAPAPREGEFAIPHDPSAAMYGLLTTAAQRLGAVALSLSDAPTTARADGLHYARADAIIVMRWLLAQLSTRKAPRISG